LIEEKVRALEWAAFGIKTREIGEKFCLSQRSVQKLILHCKKKGSDIPLSNRDVTHQSPPGQE